MMIIYGLISVVIYMTVAFIVYVVLAYAMRGSLGFVLSKEDITAISVLWFNVLILLVIAMPFIFRYLRKVKSQYHESKSRNTEA